MLKRKRIIQFFLIFVLSLSLSSAEAKFCRFFVKQKTEVSFAIKWNTYVTSRSLYEYLSTLHEDFKASLLRLKSTQVWIDLGSGKGFAGEQFVKSFADVAESPQVVLVTYNTGFFRFIPQLNGKLKLFKKRMWEDIPDNELPQAQLITDFFGAISYTRDLTTSLNKVFNHLAVGGELYIYSYNTATKIQIGEKFVLLTEFLKSIPGIKVEGKFGNLKITKLEEKIEFPNLKLIKIDEKEKPFFRIFQMQ